VNTLYNGNDLDTSTRPLIQGIATIDATHIAMVTSTGFAVGTFNATYSQLIMDQGINNAMFGPILASASSSSVTLVNVDSTHILAYAYGSTAYATCLLTVTSVSTGWALAAGPVNTFNNTAIPSGTALMVSYCALSSSFLLLVQSWLYSSNIYMQTSFIVGDSVDDYGLNLGIAMNTVSSGGTVQVLMSGNSTAIYTGLTAGQKYSNFDGNLVVGPSPQHTMFPVTFQNGSGTAILPAYEADTSATYPYAIALGSNEIQILEPMNMRGVLY
jgi:hypothetical protein